MCIPILSLREDFTFQVCGTVWSKQCLFHPRVQQSVQQGPDKRLQEPAAGCQEPLVRAQRTPSAQAAQKTSSEWETTQKTSPQEALVTEHEWILYRIHGFQILNGQMTIIRNFLQ